MEQNIDSEEVSFLQLLNSAPNIIRKKVIKQMMGSLLLTLICIGAYIYTLRWETMVGLLFAIYVAYGGANIIWRYAEGKIVSETSTCIKVSKTLKNNRICVLLKKGNEDQTDDNSSVPKYYLSGTKTDLDFVTVGTVLQIYYDYNKPFELVAWEIVDSKTKA